MTVETLSPFSIPARIRALASSLTLAFNWAKVYCVSATRRAVWSGLYRACPGSSVPILMRVSSFFAFCSETLARALLYQDAGRRKTLHRIIVEAVFGQNFTGMLRELGRWGSITAGGS